MTLESAFLHGVGGRVLSFCFVHNTYGHSAIFVGRPSPCFQFAFRGDDCRHTSKSVTVEKE